MTSIVFRGGIRPDTSLEVCLLLFVVARAFDFVLRVNNEFGERIENTK